MSFDFDAAVGTPFRMQPGLRRLARGAVQLTPLRTGERALQEKLAVLAAGSSRALLGVPGFDAAPALDALCRHAALEHPAAFGWDGSKAAALHLGWTVQDDQPLPLDHALPEVGSCLAMLPEGWRLAGLLVLAFAEDFALIDAASGRIPWLAVCLPSHWAPEDKIGRHFTEIHAPVADNTVLLAAGTHLMQLVSGADRWERFVWTITPHEGLCAHPAQMANASWSPDATATELTATAYWRTEHQTFIPLPARRQAVFTIHVEVEPLADVAFNPARAARIRDALSTMSPSVLAYRGLAQARDRLLSWLGARASP